MQYEGPYPHEGRYRLRATWQGRSALQVPAARVPVQWLWCCRATPSLAGRIVVVEDEPASAAGLAATPVDEGYGPAPVRLDALMPGRGGPACPLVPSAVYPAPIAALTLRSGR